MSSEGTPSLKQIPAPQRKRNPKLTLAEYRELREILVNRWAPEAVLSKIRERLAN